MDIHAPIGAALASGAPAHMPDDEVSRYSDYKFGLQNYQEIQKAVLPQSVGANAFFVSHRALSPADRPAGEEKLLIFRDGVGTMAYIAAQLKKSLTEAARAAGTSKTSPWRVLCWARRLSALVGGDPHGWSNCSAVSTRRKAWRRRNG